MYNNMIPVRSQLHEVLELERALARQRRRSQPALWQSLWRRWAPILALAQGQRRPSIHATLSVTHQR